jgi:hypothetical protein
MAFLQRHFAVPFPFNVILMPLTTTEWFIQVCIAAYCNMHGYILRPSCDAGFSAAVVPKRTAVRLRVFGFRFRFDKGDVGC